MKTNFKNIYTDHYIQIIYYVQGSSYKEDKELIYEFNTSA